MLGSVQQGRIKVEVEDQSQELKMADGTVVKTQGRVQFVLKCGGYQRTNFCPGISQYEQTHDSGNPVAFKGKPPH